MNCREKCTSSTPCRHRSSCINRCVYCGTDCNEKCKTTTHTIPTGDPMEQQETPPIQWHWVIDAVGTTLYSSEQITPLLGWLPSELEGLNAFELVPREEIPQAKLNFQNAVANNEPARTNVKNANGLFETIIYTIRPIRSKTTGAIIAYKGISMRAEQWAFINKPTNRTLLH
jgi:PAS domain S-box-containing protein